MTTESTRTPEEIERDIENTRAEIDHTLDVIQKKLSPRNIVNETVDQVVGGAGGFASSLGRSAKDNPIPFVLVGLGLGWLMMAPGGLRQRSSGRQWNGNGETDISGGASRLSAGDRGSDSQAYVTSPEERFHRHQAFVSSIAGRSDGGGAEGEATSSTGRDQTGKVEKAVKKAEAKAEKVVTDVQAKLRQTRGNLRERSQQAKHVLAGTIRNQPWIVGGVGLAIGAAIGAALPGRNSGDERSANDASDRRATTTTGSARKESAAEGTDLAAKSKTPARKPEETGSTRVKGTHRTSSQEAGKVDADKAKA